jgi:signal peptidase I
MTRQEIIALIITLVVLIALCVGFTFLFRYVFSLFEKDVKAGESDSSLLSSEAKKKEHPKRRKALKVTLRVLGDTLLAVLLIAFSFALLQRARGSDAFYFGVEPIVITSGSMSQKNPANTYLESEHLDNQFGTYDLIAISKYGSNQEPQLYDVVAYKSDKGQVIVHRIIEVKTADGVTTYITRGDANAASDDGVEYSASLKKENILGYYNGFCWSHAGAFVSFFQSGVGIVTVISLVYCFFAYDHYASRYEKVCAERLEALMVSKPVDPKTAE